MPVVTLTPEEFSMAIHVATDRAVESLRSDRQDRLYEKTWPDAFAVHCTGAVGEIAFAKWAGVYVDFSCRRFSGDEPDIYYNGKPCEIRARTKPYYQLKIQKNDDPQRYYVLVRGAAPDLDVVGWLKGEDGMREEWLAEHGNWSAAYFVPDESLLPMEAL